MRGNGVAESYSIVKSSSVDIMRIGLVSTNVPILDMLGDGCQSTYLTLAIYKKLY